MTVFNPLDKFYKSITGAIPENKELTMRVKGDFDSVDLVIVKDSDKTNTRHVMKNMGGYFEVQIFLARGLYYYYFDLNNGLFIGIDEDYLGSVNEYHENFQLTAFSDDYLVPDWLAGGVIYQIFPDRFCRRESKKVVPTQKKLHKNWNDIPDYLPTKNGKILNNDFFGGDIKGIISKLDYLYNLGVTAIYLNPIFEANSNHRYDTGNYFNIDSMLGTMDDFDQLISKANEYGIKIILDGVFNHTGDDSIYFNKYNRYKSIGAYNSKNSPYYNWYDFISYPDKYKAWWGVDILPAVNKDNDEYLKFITDENGVIDYYTKKGIGGWRLDVVDELPSRFVRSIRKAVKRVNKDAIIIGEVWEDASNKVSYGVRREYFQGKELDSVMNYPLKDAIINFVTNKDIKPLSYVVKQQIDHYPEKVLNSLMNILSTHDTVRLLTVVGGDSPYGMNKTDMANYSIPCERLSEAKQLLKTASLLQYTLCGVPSLYYGDEAGMQGYTDPLNRCTYPWGKEDSELINWYKFLGKLRKDFSCFADGNYFELYAEDGGYAFVRRDEQSEILVVINLGRRDLNLKFNGKLKDLISEKEFENKITVLNNEIYVLMA